MKHARIALKMASWLLAVTLVWGMTCPSGLCGDLMVSNLARNGSVEIEESSAPWYWVTGEVGGSGTNVGTWDTSLYVSATHSLKIVDNTNDSHSYWKIRGAQALGGAKYIFEWDWKHQDVTSPFFVLLRFWDGPVDSNGWYTGNWVGQTVVYTATGSLADFEHVIQIVQAPAGAQSMDVSFETGSDAAQGTLWVDNLIVRNAPSSVLNGDCEYGSTSPADWWGTPNTQWATDRVVSGNRSFKVVDTSTTSNEHWRSMATPVYDSIPLELSWSWAFENMISTGGELIVRWYTSADVYGNAAGTWLGQTTYRTGSGTQLTFSANTTTLTPPSGARCADILIYCPETVTGTMWVDDLTMIHKDRASYSDNTLLLPAAKDPRRFLRFSGGTHAERNMVSSLAGIVAQVRPEVVWIDSDADDSFLDDMAGNYNTPHINYTSDPWLLVHNFKDNLLNKRYILYSEGTDSESVAASLAGLFGALMVDEDQQTQANALGLQLFMDVRSSPTEQGVLTTYGRELNDTFAIELDYNRFFMKDYASFARMFVFNGDKTLKENVLAHLGTGGFLLGTWVRNTWSTDERENIKLCSQYGVSTVPTEFNRNFPSYSSMVEKDISITQNTHCAAVPEVWGNKHYVAIVVSDGDNVAINLGGLPVQTNWWLDPDRLNANESTYFDLSWTLSPLLTEFAPAAMQQIYNQAHQWSSAKDHFIAGCTGNGVIYCLDYPDGNEQAFADETAVFMDKADMTVLNVIENDATISSLTPTLYNKFSNEPNIEGILYIAYSDYRRFKGEIGWSDARPVVSAKYRLWSDASVSDSPPLDPTYASSICTMLNNDSYNPPRPDTEKGYSFVIVNWNYSSFDEVKSLVDGLDDNIKVVTAEELIRVIRTALGTSPWQFDLDDDGWQAEVLQSGKGSATWSNTSLRMDANDQGSGDSDPNVRWMKVLDLPLDAQTLRLKVKAYSSLYDANFRVRMWYDGMWRELTSWTLISSTSYQTINASIPSGTTGNYHFALEIDDDGDRYARLYIDNVELIDSNLLYNGTSEVNDGAGWPAGWGRVGTPEWSCDIPGKSPIHHFELNGTGDEYYSKGYSLSGVSTLDWSFWWQFADVPSGNFTMLLRFYSGVDQNGNGSGWISQQYFDTGTGTQGSWEYKSLSNIQKPAGANYFDVSIYGHGAGGGTFRVDDIRVLKVN